MNPETNTAQACRPDRSTGRSIASPIVTAGVAALLASGLMALYLGLADLIARLG